MPAKHEQDSAQSAYLYDLLDLQAQNDGYEVRGLNAKIQKARVVMSEPEIAWVEKHIAETHKTNAK